MKNQQFILHIVVTSWTVVWYMVWCGLFGTLETSQNSSKFLTAFDCSIKIHIVIITAT